MKEEKLLPIIIAISAVITGLTIAFPQYFGALEWISISPVLFALIRLRKKGAKLGKYYIYGVLYFGLYGVTVYHWFVYLYPMEFTGLDNASSIAVILLAIFGLSIIEGAISSLSFLIVGGLSATGLYDKSPFIEPILFSALFAVFEYLKCFGWFGIPLARLSLGQSSFMPILATSSLFGSYLITALIVFVNALLAISVSERKKRLISKISLGAAVLSFSVNLIVGSVIYTDRQDASEGGIRVALVQGNFPSTEIMETDPKQNLSIYEDLTRLAASDGADVIVWPEGSVEFFLDESSALSERLSQLAIDVDSDIILCATASEKDKIYNASFHISSTGEFSKSYYAKQHLVPFGEYVPMKKFVELVAPYLSDVNLFSFDFTPGDGTVCFDTANLGRVGNLICFDSIYEDAAIGAVKDGAEIIVLPTNDSWFSESAAMNMHANHARLRAIELSRTILRAANTGITAIITPDGEYAERLAVGERGYLIDSVSTNDDATLYSIIGNAFVYFCMAEIIILAGYGVYLIKIGSRREVHEE